MPTERPTIVVWYCEVCGYWRKEKATAIHQTTNPDDPTGKMAVHVLHPKEFVLAS